MNTLLLFATSSFIGSLTLWAIYWLIVRPYLVEKAVNRIAAVHNELVCEKLNDTEGARSRMAQEMLEETSYPEDFKLISIFSILVFFIKNQSSIIAESSSAIERREEAPQWLKKLDQDHTRAIQMLLIVNCPVAWPAIALVMFLSLDSQKARRFMDSITYTSANPRFPQPPIAC